MKQLSTLGVAPALLALAFVTPAPAATTIALPDGFRLAAADGVATHRDRHALALVHGNDDAGSRIQQVEGSSTVFTDLEGVADRLEYSADGLHVLVRHEIPAGEGQPTTRRFSLIDSAGEIVWSAASQADYRFTAGGNLLYVAHFPGDAPHIRVFDVRGNVIRAVRPARPYLDARVLGNGEEALILFSGPASRASDPQGGREVSIERIRFGERTTVVWSVRLDPDALKYPELIPVDDTWQLIPTRAGFIAVNNLGETTRHATDGPVGAWATPGGKRDTAVVLDRGRARTFDLATGDTTSLDADPSLRFGDVGYRDGRVVLSRPGEVIVKSIDEPASEPRRKREKPDRGRAAGR